MNNKYPEWVLRYKTKGVQIRQFGNNYYAYHPRCVYDKINRKPKSLPPEYLGVVTKNGIVKKDDISKISGDYEYGNIALLYGIAENTVIPVLKKYFPYMYSKIIIYVILRNINPLPMKSVKYLYEKTYLTRLNESMNGRSLSSMVSSLSYDKCNSAMKEMTLKGEYLLMDSTAIFSRSANISMLEPGHNTHNMHIPQVNIMLLFSSSRKLPTFIRVIPGSVRDVTAMSKTIEMADIEKCIIVADKGFYPTNNIKMLKKSHLSYIIPVRRNSKMIIKDDEFLNIFLYNGKPVKYWKYKNNIYTYEDPILKMEEEKDYLIRVKENRKSKKSFHNDSVNFGKIYLYSDIVDDPEKIYRLYKEREYVEYAFNVLKNDLEADRSYLRDDNMLFSYMFLNLISLYLHFQILNAIDGKYSVKDILLILSRIKIYTTGNSEILSEIPKKAREIVEKLNIDLNILRKK